MRDGAQDEPADLLLARELLDAIDDAVDAFDKVGQPRFADEGTRHAVAEDYDGWFCGGDCESGDSRSKEYNSAYDAETRRCNPTAAR